MSEFWPPIDAKLKTLPVAVTMTDEELSFRATDPALSWKLLRELLAFFDLPSEQRRLERNAARRPEPDPVKVTEWVAWTNANGKIHADLRELAERQIAWDQDTERREGVAAPTYVVFRSDNAREWSAIQAHFAPLSGREPTASEIIDRAMDVKRETMPRDEFGRFFHSYIA